MKRMLVRLYHLLRNDEQRYYTDYIRKKKDKVKREYEGLEGDFVDEDIAMKIASSNQKIFIMVNELNKARKRASGE